MNAHLFLKIVALNLIGLLLVTLFWPHLMISPGQPIAAHADFADDCFACHTPFIGATSEQCIACHPVDRIGLETVDGQPLADNEERVAFHRQLIEEECLACHSEHRGVQAFRPIGRFSHDLLQMATREQCDGCHLRPEDSLHRRIEGNCALCHSSEAWLPARFEHDRYFRFDRDHETACVTCHVDHDYSRYTCYGCHEHSRSKIRKEHWEEGIRDFEECVDCHRSGDEDEAKSLWRQRSGGATRYDEASDRDREHTSSSKREEEKERRRYREEDHDDG